jgi:uncharacterized protein
MSDLARLKELARAYVDCTTRGDPDGLADFFTEDGVIVIESRTLLPAEMRGRETIRAGVREVIAAFPDGLTLTIDDMTAEENRVAVRAHSRGVHVSGKLYENRYMFLLYFKGDKLMMSREFMDSLRVTEVFFDGAKPA